MLLMTIRNSSIFVAGVVLRRNQMERLKHYESLQFILLGFDYHVITRSIDGIAIDSLISKSIEKINL